MARPEVTGRRRPEQYAPSERQPVQPRAPPESAVAPSDDARTSEKLPCNIPRGAYRIREFARSHGFSRAHYYVLKKLGQAPNETDVGGVIVITMEDAARWREQRSGASRQSDDPG